MDWISLINQGFSLDVVFKLCLAALVGGLIGIEREIHGRPAGFRTHLLVSLGACLMMLTSEEFYLQYQHLAVESVVRLDPARVAAQIVTGIGFLGAGAILKERHSIRGLTTAACLWLAAGLGMAVGLGMYTPALLVTALALFSLLFLKQIEGMLKIDRYRTLEVGCEDLPELLDRLREILARNRLRLVDCGVEMDSDSPEITYRLVVAYHGAIAVGDASRAILGLKGVRRVRFR